VKRFLKDHGGIDQYPDVSIEWLRHHNPDLTIYENGKVLQTIDLSRYNHKQLHELFAQHFARSGRMLTGTERGEESSSTSSDSNSSDAMPRSRPQKNRESAHDAALPQPNDSSRGRQAAELQPLSSSAADLGGGTYPFRPQLVGGVLLSVAIGAWVALRRGRLHRRANGKVARIVEPVHEAETDEDSVRHVA